MNDIPPEIIEAARKVELWFKHQGIKKWALMGIQSRELFFGPIPPSKDRGLVIVNETITDVKPPRYNTE